MADENEGSGKGLFSFGPINVPLLIIGIVIALMLAGVGFTAIYGMWQVIGSAKAGSIPLWAVALIIGAIFYIKRD